MSKLTIRNWRKYRIRSCFTLHTCELCKLDIRLTDTYYDGGYGRRVHTECVRDLERRLGRCVDEDPS